MSGFARSQGRLAQAMRTVPLPSTGWKSGTIDIVSAMKFLRHKAHYPAKSLRLICAHTKLETETRFFFNFV